MLVSRGLRHPGFIFYVPTTGALRRSVRFAVGTAALCVALWGGYAAYGRLRDTATAVSAAPVAAHILGSAAPASAHLKPAPAPSAAGQALTVATPQPSSQLVVSECTPDHSYAPAGPLSLPALGPGLHEVIDPTHYYRVYGDSAAEIGQQIARCAPTTSASGDETFSGETDYWLGWQFSYALSGNQCIISTMTVGLHITQVYPEWQAAPGTQNGVSAQWQSFMRGLKTHEQGHVALGQTYAHALLTDVQSMSAPTCADLVGAANAAANREAAALIVANNQYDAATNHGATQGAILR